MSVTTRKIDNNPSIVADDILLFDANAGVGSYGNTLSGSFTYPSGDKPCSIMINKGVDIFSSACHAWLGFPESVIYRYKDGKFGIGKFKSTSEIPNRANVLWAIGGLGLLDKYNPAEEGFSRGVKPDGGSYDYTDVLRDTNHTILGIKNNQCYLMYVTSKTGTEVNTLAKWCDFEYAIMLDGGHIAAINGSESYAKINLSTKQGYVIQGISANFGTIPTSTETPIKTPVITPVSKPITINHESIGSLPIKTDLTTVNFTKGRTGSIAYIVIHYTANDGDTDENNGNYFDDDYRGASAHYFIDEDSATQVVKDEDTAWHCNDTQKYTNGGATYKKLCNNNNSISIELCSDKDAAGEYIITKETQENAKILIRHLMAEHNIAINKIIRHYDVSGKICPEPFVKHSEQWDSFKKGITETTIIHNSSIYKVQLGAYPQKKSAEGLMQKLTSLGYKSIVIVENNLYKVQLGVFSVEANALAVETQLEKLGYKVDIIEVAK